MTTRPAKSRTSPTGARFALDGNSNTCDAVKRPRIVTALLGWFEGNARDLPWRRTRDPYGIWVSEILLQQTQVKTVIPYWERWMRALPTIRSLARAPSGKIHKLWEGLGYYHRVRNIQQAAQRIVREHGGKFPERFDDVLSLPGIGRYTAGAICSIAFDQARPILDGNVMRLLTRVYGIRGNPQQGCVNQGLWALAEQLVLAAAETKSSTKRAETKSVLSTGPCSRLNQALMELGAVICTPKNPRCDACPLRGLCVAHHKGMVNQLPQLRSSRPITRRHFCSFVVEHRGRFLVRQRAAGYVNAYLWEFPNVEVNEDGPSPRQAAQTLFGKIRMNLDPLCSITHSITRYRITLRAYRVLCRKRPACAGARWIESRQCEKFAFTSAHKKILKRLRQPCRSPGEGMEQSPFLGLRGNGARSG